MLPLLGSDCINAIEPHLTQNGLRSKHTQSASMQSISGASKLQASKTSAEQEQRTPADIQSFFQEPTSHLTSEDAVVPEWRNPGIRNDSGENNCFLSALIQCLWGCADFRYLVLSLPAFSYKVSPWP